MQFKQIEAFIAIAKSGSLAKASELMYTTPAALSQRIKQFESQLGAEVFIRTSRGMELSVDGKKIYSHAVNIVNGIKDLNSSVENIESSYSPINIGLSSAFGAEFTKQLTISKIPEEYSHNIKRISDDAIIFSLKNKIIDIGVAYDSSTNSEVLSTYAGNTSFIVVSRYKEIPRGNNIKVYCPNIKELLYQTENKLFSNTRVRYNHSDCYEIAIQHVLVNNSIAVIDSHTAEIIKQRHPEIILSSDKFTLPFYIYCLRNEKDRYQPVFDAVSTVRL